MKTILALLIMATFAIGETTWTATWNASKDYNNVGDYTGLASGYYLNVYDSNDSLVNEFDTSDTTYIFTGPDSVCATVRAYDSNGNVSEETIPVCVTSFKEWMLIDYVKDDSINVLDKIKFADKWRVFRDSSKYDPAYDISPTEPDSLINIFDNIKFNSIWSNYRKNKK